MLPFRKVEAWKRARAAVVVTYRLTRQLPKEELFCLSSQMRRAAVGIICNIAEGSKRTSPKDYAHFLNMAEGSAAELVILLELCVELELLQRDRCEALAKEYDEIERMLYALRRKVWTPPRRGAA